MSSNNKTSKSRPEPTVRPAEIVREYGPSPAPATSPA